MASRMIMRALHPSLLRPTLPVARGRAIRCFAGDATWALLQAEVLPSLLARRHHAPLRVWCIGPGALDDAYSMLMLLAERWGTPAVRTRAKIFATAAEAQDLEAFHDRWHPGEALAHLPTEHLERCFERAGELYMLRPELQDGLVLGRHDPLTWAPLGRMDVLFCRDSLSRLDHGSMRLILRRLHFGLEPHGYLVLGEDERGLLADGELYEPVAESAAIFRKAGSCTLRTLLPLATVPAAQPPAVPELVQSLSAGAAGEHCGHLLLDREGRILQADAIAADLLALAPPDLVDPPARWGALQEDSGLADAVRPAIDRGSAIQVRDVECRLPSGHIQHFDLEVVPLRASPGQGPEAIVRLHPAGSRRAHDWRARIARRQFELRIEALHAAEEELRSTCEELEQANQELHAASQKLASSLAMLVAEQQALREELESLAAAFDATAQAILVAGADGTIVACNEAAAASLGCPPVSMRGQPLAAFVQAEEGRPAAEVAAGFAMPQRTAPVAAGAALARRADGTTFAVDLAVTRTTSSRRALSVVTLRARETRSASDRPQPAADFALDRASDLTQRERDVMRLLVEGRQSKEIAHRLGISRRTVDVHRGRLMRKAGARNVADLMRMAIAGGLSKSSHFL